MMFTRQKIGRHSAEKWDDGARIPLIHSHEAMCLLKSSSYRNRPNHVRYTLVCTRRFSSRSYCVLTGITNA